MRNKSGTAGNRLLEMENMSISGDVFLFPQKGIRMKIHITIQKQKPQSAKKDVPLPQELRRRIDAIPVSYTHLTLPTTLTG